MPDGLTDAQIIDRLQRLERNLEKLAAATGVELEDPAEGLDPEVVALARRGDRMAAAKLLSERSDADFVEAQRVIDRL